MTLEECIKEVACCCGWRPIDYLARPLVLTDLNKEEWVWEQDFHFMVPNLAGFYLEGLVSVFPVSARIDVARTTKGFLTSWMPNEPVYCPFGSQVQLHILEPSNQNTTMEVINILKGGGEKWDFVLAGHVIEPKGRTIQS